MENSPSSNTTVLTSTGRLLPTNHLPRTLLFAQIHDKAAKTAANPSDHQQFYNELNNSYNNIITAMLLISVQWNHSRFRAIQNLLHCCHPFDDARDNLEAPNKLASTTSTLQTNKALKFFTFIPTYPRKKQKLNLKSISWWLQDLLLH
jgi:hypothetical protein